MFVGLVAEDIDVVAGVDEEDGEAVGITDGALLLGAGKPLDDVEVAGVGGDRNEESASDEGCGVADKGLGKEGTALDSVLLITDT